MRTIRLSLIITQGMLGGLFKLRLFSLFIAILDITEHAGWQYGNTVIATNIL